MLHLSRLQCKQTGVVLGLSKLLIGKSEQTVKVGPVTANRLLTGNIVGLSKLLIIRANAYQKR